MEVVLVGQEVQNDGDIAGAAAARLVPEAAGSVDLDNAGVVAAVVFLALDYTLVAAVVGSLDVCQY